MSSTRQYQPGEDTVKMNLRDAHRKYLKKRYGKRKDRLRRDRKEGRRV